MATETDLQKLVVTLEARTTQFEKALQRANSQAQKQTKAIERRFQAMNASVAKAGTGMAAGFGSLKTMLGAAGITIGIQQIISGMKEILANADDLVDTGKRLGILPTQLELFRRAAEIGGASAGELDAGLKKLQVNWVQAATKGGKFADFLKSQGVALRDASGDIPDLNRQMEIMVDLLSRTDDEATRAAIATLAFGRGAAALGEALAGTSLADARAEFEKYGQASDEQIQKLADAHDTIEEFWSAFKRNAAIATAEGITALDNFGSEVSELGGLINDFLANPSNATFFDMLFGKGAAAAVGIGKPIQDGTDAIIRQQEEIARATREMEALVNEARRLSEEDPTWDTSAIEARINELKQQIAELNAQLRDTVGLFGQMSGMRAQAESYVSWLERRATGYDAVPGAPPQPAYSPTALPQRTVPLEKPKIEVELEVDDEELDDAAKKLKDAADKMNSANGSLADRLTRAIGAWETRGMTPQQAYAARGGAGEYGRYQIMPYNVTAWSKELYGHPVSHSYFASHPEIQDEIARFKIGQYLEKYGLEGAIRSWNTGQPGGTTTAGYVPGVMGMLESGAGFEDASAGLKDFNEQLNITTDRFAEIRPMAEDFANTFVDGILEGKSAVEALGDALEELGRSLLKMGIHQLVGAIFPAGAPLLAAGGNIYPGNAYKVHKDELIVPRIAGKVIPASKANGGMGALALTYAPSIVVQGNADEGMMRAMQERMLVDIEQRLPSMVRKAHSNRTL